MLESRMFLDLGVATVVLPVLAALAVLWLWRLGRKDSGRGGFGPALCVGYLIGHLGAAGAPRLPPTDSTQGLFYCALLATLVGVAFERLEPGRRARLALVLPLLAAVLWLTLRPLVRYTWTVGESVAWMSAFTLGGGGLWAAFDGLARQPRGASSAAGWLTAYVATGLLLLLGHTALLAQLAFVVAAGLAVLLVLEMRSAVAPTWTAAVPLLAAVHAALLLAGTFYADLRRYEALVLAVAPLGSALAQVRAPHQPAARLRQVVVGSLGVLVLVAPLLTFAAVDYLHQEPTGEYEY